MLNIKKYIGNKKTFPSQLPSHSQSKKEQGFTLIELIISMAIGALIISGIMGIFVTNTNASNHVIKTTHLNQEVRTLLGIMSNGIRKSGYWANTAAATALNNNPFGIEKVSNNPNCILFTYDTDDASDVILISEKYGYRLNNGTIESRVNGGACALSDTWETLSNKETIEITKLTFSQNINCTNISDTSASNCTVGSIGYVTPNVNDVLIEMRSINVEIIANLKLQPSTSLELKDTIIVVNDSTKIVPM